MSNRSTIPLALSLVLCALGASMLTTPLKARPVKAPYDGMFCASTSFNQCLGRITGLTQDAQMSLLTGIHGTLAVSAADSPDPGHAVIGSTPYTPHSPSAPIQYKCNFGAALYKPGLRPDDARPAVIVSPQLLLSIRQHILELRSAQDACRNLIDAFNYEVSHQLDNDHINQLNDKASILLAKLSTESAIKGQIGGGTESDQVWAGADGALVITYSGTRNEVLERIRGDVITRSSAVRDKATDRAMISAYGGEFRKAQLLIDTAFDDLARDLLLLDQAEPLAQGAALQIDPGAADGTWVTKDELLGQTP
jgi:hypothetical protein